MYYKILKYIFWTKLIATYDAINLFQEFIKVNINNINEKKKYAIFRCARLNRVNLMTLLKFWSKTRTATFHQGHGSTHCLTFRMNIFMIHDLVLRKRRRSKQVMEQ